MSITENLKRLREEVASACTRAGRSPETVHLMAVSKTHPASALHEAYRAGQRLFGENRVQEFSAKAPELAVLPGLNVHLIGPLQSNKTSPAARLFQAVDTLDSQKIATRLDAAAAELGRVLPVLIEVKLSPEDTKHGLAPDELPEMLAALSGLPHLCPAGLMTVPPLDAPGEQARPYFRQLRELRDRYQSQYPTLQELSMGMSGDFAVAIEEGSTTVRIGTAIFGHRESM